MAMSESVTIFMNESKVFPFQAPYKDNFGSIANLFISFYCCGCQPAGQPASHQSLYLTSLKILSSVSAGLAAFIAQSRRSNQAAKDNAKSRVWSHDRFVRLEAAVRRYNIFQKRENECVSARV